LKWADNIEEICNQQLKGEIMNSFSILIVNPKLTNTQIALYADHKLIFLTKIRHPVHELAVFRTFADQVEYRKDSILSEINNNDIDFSDLKIVIGRGGLIKPVKSGVYEVNEAMKNDLINSPIGEDVVNLGGLVAAAIAAEFPQAKAIIADSVVVDEMCDLARISGHPDFHRQSVFHALNQKAVANMHAKTLSKNYEDLNLIVAHIGNGTSVGAHHKGKVIDVNQGLDGDGPFSATRSGSLPIGDVIRRCFSGKYSQDQMLDLVRSHGGLIAYLETDHINKIEKNIEDGDEKALTIIQAMAYQVSKCIGSMYAVLKCDVNAILITGDLAHGNTLIKSIIEHIGNMAPVFIYPGDDEIKAMATSAMHVLKGDLVINKYV
jgi:butyrate kinase